MTKKENIDDYIPYIVGGAIVGAIALNYLSNNHFSLATSSGSEGSGGSSSSSGHPRTGTGHHTTSHSSSHPATHHTATPVHHPTPVTHHTATAPVTHHDSPLTTHHINTHTAPLTAVHKVTHPATTHQTATTTHNNADAPQAQPGNDNMEGFGFHQAYAKGGHSSGHGGHNSGHNHSGSGGHNHSGNHGTGTSTSGGGGSGGNHISGTTGHQHATQGNTNNTKGPAAPSATKSSSNIPATTHFNPQHTRPITKGKPLNQAIDGNPVKLDPTMKSSNKPNQNPNPKPSNPVTNPTKIVPEYPTTGKYIGGEQFGHDWDPAYKMGSSKPAKDGKPAVNNDHASSRNVTYQNFKNFEATSYVKMGQPTDGRKNAFGDKAAYAMIEAGGPPQSDKIHGCCNYMIGLHGDGTIYAREEGDHVAHPTEGRMTEDGKQIPGIGALKPGETIGLKMVLLRNLKGNDNRNHVRLIGKVDRNNDGNWQTVIDRMDPYGVGNDGKQYPVLTDISMPVNGKPPTNFSQEARTRFDQLGAATPYNNYTAVHEIDPNQLDNFGNPISRSDGNNGPTSGTTTAAHYSVVPVNTKGYGNIMGSTTQHHTSPLSLRRETKTQLPVGYNNYLYLYNNS